MTALSEVAVNIAREMSPQRYGRRIVADFQALAAAELANALRVGEHPDLALRLMRTAVDLLRLGTGDPLLRARVLDLSASLFRYRRRLDLSSRILDRVFKLYLRLGDRHMAGRSLLKNAIAVKESGETEHAVDLLLRSLRLMDPNRDSTVIAVGIHALVGSLVDLNLYREAAEMLEETRSLVQTGVNPRRVTWIEGRIAHGLEDNVTAEAKFVEVRNGFRAQGLHYDAALASLDLGVVLAKQGRLEELRLLVGEMVSTFERQGVEREAIAAVMLLREALHEHEAPLFLIDRIAEFLRRLPVEPDLRIEAFLQSRAPSQP